MECGKSTHNPGLGDFATSIIANLDINLRGNTQSIDKAADSTEKRISELRQSVDTHTAAFSARFSQLGNTIKAAFLALPGAGVITAVLSPAVGLARTIGTAFTSLVPAIGAATTSMSAFGVATTVATGGLNLILAGVAATAAAVIGAGTAWTGLGLASMGGIKDAQKAADRLGISVESIQGFAFKSKLGIDELSGLLTKFQKNIGEGKSDAFQKLGLNAAQLKNLRPEEQLNQIADAFNGIGNQADRVALSMELFGREGAAALKLLKGGSEGIRQSLEEAKSLGIIVGGNEAKQVAEASAALSMMRQAMTGLGKTAAITIAPFVKMIADGLTSALKWINSYREQIVDFGYTVEFVFKNFSDYVKLYFNKALLSLTEFANATLHLFTDVLPQLFVSFGELIQNAITTGFSGGFDKAWRKAVADIKASMNRESGEVETNLRNRVNALEKELDEKKKKFLEEKKAAIAPPQNGESVLGPEKTNNAAVERGSQEAFKIIANTQGDKYLKAANDRLAELRKHSKLLDKILNKIAGRIAIAKGKV